MKLLIFSLSFLLLLDCKKILNVFSTNYKWVINKNGIILRSSPSINSKALLHLEQGKKLKILDETKKEETIDGIKGHWVKVSRHHIDDEIIGFVFDAYLFIPPLKPYPTLKITSKNIQEFKEGCGGPACLYSKEAYPNSKCEAGIFKSDHTFRFIDDTCIPGEYSLIWKIIGDSIIITVPNKFYPRYCIEFNCPEDIILKITENGDIFSNQRNEPKKALNIGKLYPLWVLKYYFDIEE